MLCALHVLLIMSSAFFNPSFAFSSHFDTDGAPLSELSWPSSLAVVAVSFSGLFTFVFLMLACLCCKKGDVGFKEFENTEGDEYQADLSTLASPSSQNGPDVYVLPLTEVSLPVAKQPNRSVQLLKSSDLGRHSLLYLREIGDGWFGKVLLGEVHEGLSTTQVVVKELKASASVQEQMQFLEEVQPYRKLQHAALLLCLAQCSEVTPYLLIMEFCPLGDVKSYLCSCRAADSETPDPLILQQMACDIASGLLHLHKYNFVHSDLALRNCLLTSDMSVKIGDYGLSHSRFKDDYYITQDQIWVPLRWIAPELIDEVHGNLLVVDQTRSSNIWSLGVTMWELFELGHQPYQLYSDRQVLMYTVKEQQLKLSKPQLQFCLAERWYEVMQFCWLQPELRPSGEEVHLLITYLCAKGSSEAEEDFEKRWNTLRPNLLGSASHTAASAALIVTPKPAATDALGTDQNQAMELTSSASSSFPLLEHFSDSFHSDPGDDLLTVTETSHGLNFEYKWEQARAEQPYCSSLTSGPLGQGNPHYQDIYYCSKGNSSGGCKEDSLTSSISPSHYEPEHPGVVPVLSAHSPSVSSEYYIRIEEAAECSLSLDDGVVDNSLTLEASISHTSSPTAQPKAYWLTADNSKSSAYGSGSSPAVQLTMEPLVTKLSCSSPVKFDPSHKCYCSYQTDATAREQEPTNIIGQESSVCALETSPEYQSNLFHPAGQLESPNSLSQAVSSPSLGFCDPYLEARTLPNGSSHHMMGPLRKAVPIINHISIEVETDDGLMLGQWRSDTESNLFSERETTNWSSNHSANNNILSFDSRQTARDICSSLDLQCDAHSSDSQLWSLSKGTTTSFHTSGSTGTFEAAGGRADAHNPTELDPHIHLCHRQREAVQIDVNLENVVSPISNAIIRYSDDGNMAAKSESLVKGERLYSQPKMIPEAGYLRSPSSFQGPQRCQRRAPTHRQMGNVWDKMLVYPETPESSTSALHESGVSLTELGDYSDDDDDDDIKEITSGIFADFNLDYSEVEEEELTLLKNPEGTPESVDTLNISSALVSPCDQAFSPDPFNTPVLPKSLDSGYETENHESPEFIFKELGDPTCVDSPRLGKETELLLQVGLGQGISASSSPSKLQLKSFSEKNPHRDSAYFSDFDAECERSPQEEGSQFFDDPTNSESSHRDGDPIKNQLTREQHFTCLRHIKSCVLQPSSPHHICTPGLSMLSPFPPQMGGCLTKESAADDDLEFETEHPGEEPCSELSSSASSDSSSTTQDSSANKVEGNKKAEDCCPSHNLAYDYRNEEAKDSESRSMEDEEELPEFKKVKEVKQDRRDGAANNEEDFEDIDADECDSLCEESNGPVDFSSSSSLLELCGEDVRAPLEEAEDEDESDDSESDEELRTYNIQDEDSEGSEQDFTAVPVVVSNSSGSQHLRSLLKMPTLLSDSFCNELETKKKAVSFFDDVTVFLFDQESPTGELADFSACPGGESCRPETRTGNLSDPQPPAETCCDSEETDTVKAEEGGSSEWEEKLPFEARSPLPEAVPESTSPPTSAEAPNPASVALNRFMVSRFSITHISDPTSLTSSKP